MSTLLMLMAGIVAAPADGWRFVDESIHAGRSVLTFRTIDLAAAPANPLHADDHVAKGAKFGAIALGPGGKQRFGLVWHAETATTHAPLAGLAMKVTVDAAARPGEAVSVRPDVIAGPLYLTRCAVGSRFAEIGREVSAAIMLCEPGSAVLDRTASGFV